MLTLIFTKFTFDDKRSSQYVYLTSLSFSVLRSSSMKRFTVTTCSKLINTFLVISATEEEKYLTSQWKKKLTSSTLFSLPNG